MAIPRSEDPPENHVPRQTIHPKNETGYAMTDEQWDRVEQLFEEALARPAEERATFLEETCDDPAVRREVASLLGMADEAEDLFHQLTPAVREQQRQQKAEWESGPPDDPLDLEGTEVGRYRVDTHLGGGGMGVVYRAHDTQLDRPVALKFLPPHLAAHPEAEKRFAREAKAAAALDHPHIATIHEIGETEAGRHFIAMAYYEGETLRERLDREGPLPIEEAVEYATQIAEGLARAHEAGIVHRDVKPGNVMVTEEDTVKIVDFGLARVADQSRLTEPGRRIGTAVYMSPEQAEGEEVRAQTDVWALGVVLYEMLTGERPFEGERETAVLHAIIREEPTPLSENREEVPSGLEATVERCLAKDRERRYPSAAALLEDLRALGLDAATVSPETRTAHAGTDAAYRRWVLGAAAALALVLAFGWALWPSGGAPEAGESASATTGPSPARSIAVLPFEPVGRGEPGPFANGLHGDLITRLSGVSGLQVIAEPSVERYRNSDLALAAIADTLGASWIIRGSVQEAGAQIQVNAQLIDSRTETTAWAEQYRQKLTTENLFAIQGEITREIARALQAELTSEERGRLGQRPTGDLEAYRLYARGRELLARRTDSTMDRAEELFRRAVERDSTFAQAWAGLAKSLFLYPESRGRDPDRVLPRGRKAARRALELDPELPEAHEALAIVDVYRMRGPAALRRTERVLALDPSHAKAYHVLNMLHLTLGRPKEALKYAERAVALSPLSPENQVGLAWAALAVGDNERGFRAARRRREIEPEYHGTYLEGYALYRLGKLTERDTVVSEGVRRLLMALEEVTAGNEAPVRKLLERYQKKRNDLGYRTDLSHVSFRIGLLQAALGQRAEAISTFEAAFEEQEWSGGGQAIRLRYFYPDVLGPLRRDPRWEELMRSINVGWGLNPDGSLPEETGRTQTSTR